MLGLGGGAAVVGNAVRGSHPRPATVTAGHTANRAARTGSARTGSAHTDSAHTDSAHAAGGGAGLPTGTTPIAAPRSASKLLGQRIMVGLTGTSASGALLGSVRRGEVGAVILFGSNIASRQQTLALTNSLQRAAHAGGNPGLLIATDQEGGEVKRLPSGPPGLSPPQMVATGHVATAASEGRATGRYLRGWGIDMDLAPVADVPTFHGAFIFQQGRAFSFNAGTVADYATAFAVGLQAGRVAATAKHFPGLGSAAVSTDLKREELRPTAAQRQAALVPYAKLIASGGRCSHAVRGGLSRR